MKSILLTIILISGGAFASSTRTLHADDIKSPDLTKTFTLPASSTTLVGTATTDTLTNKTINGSSNTITNISLTTAVTGTLPIANGGTGQTSAANAINALLPSQSGNNGKFLTSDGSVSSWGTLAPTFEQETPSGTVDGSNTSFTLGFTPSPTNSLQVFVDGVLQVRGGGEDYTQTGTTLTFVTAPALGQSVRAYYTR